MGILAATRMSAEGQIAIQERFMRSYLQASAIYCGRERWHQTFSATKGEKIFDTNGKTLDVSTLLTASVRK